MNWVVWTLLGLTVLCVAALAVEAALSLRTRGEEAGVPEDYMRAVPFRADRDNDLTAIADATTPLNDWQQWEQEMKETAR